LTDTTELWCDTIYLAEVTNILLAILISQDINATEMTEFFTTKKFSIVRREGTFYTFRRDRGSLRQHSKRSWAWTSERETEAHCVNTANAVERGHQNVKVRIRKTRKNFHTTETAEFVHFRRDRGFHASTQQCDRACYVRRDRNPYTRQNSYTSDAMAHSTHLDETEALCINGKRDRAWTSKRETVRIWKTHQNSYSRHSSYKKSTGMTDASKA